jgi:beta-glucanase (GH16 family)
VIMNPMRRPALPAGRGGRFVLALVAVLAAVLVVVGGVVVVRAGKEHQVERAGWTLLWQDEFDGESLDWFRWSAQDTASPRNHELQYYTPNEVRVSGGQLHLSSRRAAYRDRAFTSGAVDTYGKFSFTYGRVEVRARLPKMGQGIWPAVWMLGAGCNPLGPPCPWPTAPATEIDILEAVNSPTTLHTNLHYGTSPGTTLSAGPTSRPVSDLSDSFHTFALEWEPGGVIRWFLDDELFDERRVPGWFDQPMYLLMNTAVGGDWPGPPASDTAFPQQFAIDSVRVYQRS